MLQKNIYFILIKYLLFEFLMAKLIKSKDITKNRFKIRKNKKYRINNKIKSKKIPKRKIMKFKKSLYVVSPFSFSDFSRFHYLVKNVVFFKKFANDLNNYKPNIEEKNFLDLIIRQYKNKINNSNIKTKYVMVKKSFYNSIINLVKIDPPYNEINERIINLAREIQNESSVSINKIINKYQEKFGVKLSKTTVHRKLRNKLKFSFKKICLKPKDLEKPNYKQMGFIFIKILIRALYLNYNIVYIDESNFQLQNSNFRSWIKKEDPSHYGYKGNGKINFLMAISQNNIINWKFTKENTNSEVFCEFFEETIAKINSEEKNKTLYIMDNHTSHISKYTLKLVNKHNIKILFSVPYESSFNSIELSFRYIKNIIYKNIFQNMGELRKKVEEILKSKEFRNAIEKNFVETLERYNYFININQEFNMNIN